MEGYIKIPMIEEKWTSKRKREAEDRRKAKKARIDNTKPENGPDVCTDEKDKRSQGGFQTEYLEFITEHFGNTFTKFDAFKSACSFYKKMVSRDL